MATKRRLATKRFEEPPPKKSDIDHGTWAKNVLAKYWYVVICLFVDIAVPLDLYGRSGLPLGQTMAFIVLFGLVLLEIFIYLKVWGTNGIWHNSEDEDD